MSTAPTPCRDFWREKIAEAMERGMDRVKAGICVDKEYPGLRQEMIDEAN